MGERHKIKIDLAQLRLNRAAALGRPFSEQDALDWLAGNGFEVLKGGWVIADGVDLGLLEPNEFVDFKAELMKLAYAQSTPERPIIPRRVPADSFEAVPAILLGRHRDVRPHWRKIARAALKTGSWDQALEGQEFVALGSTPGLLVMQGPSILIQGENLLMYLVRAELDDILYKKKLSAEQWEETLPPLLRDGLNRLWFALSIVSEKGTPGLLPLFVHDPWNPDRNRQLNRDVLRGVLRWWPQIVHYAAKFWFLGEDPPTKWPLWGLNLLPLCSQLGMPKDGIETLKSLDPKAAGESMQKFLDTTS